MALVLGCTTEEKETTTKGKLHVFIPESIAPVMIDEVNEFLQLYQANGAQITGTIVSADTAAYRFMNDQSRIVFLPRSLSQAEKEKVRLHYPDFNELIVAYDGIVVVVHPKNRIAKLSTTELKNILSGSITRWEQLTKTMTGPMNIYLHDSSDVSGYLTQRLLPLSGITATLTRTVSDLQTLHSVEKDHRAIGFAALGWIDSAKSPVSIVNLGRTSEDTDTSFASPAETSGNFYSPHPANLFRNYYPLKRAIYMYTGGRIGLATGFGTYVSTNKGQRIFLKYGLLPGTQKIRLKSNEPE